MPLVVGLIQIQFYPQFLVQGCVGGVSTVAVGSAAQSNYTGVVANGVLGAVNANNPSMSMNFLGTAIEAQLGNLESAQNAQQAGVDTGPTGLNVTPQAGWYAFYYSAARQFLQPMMSDFNAIISFINEMAIISDIHYGFIAFNDNIGTSPTSVSAPMNNVSSYYNYLTPKPSYYH